MFEGFSGETIEFLNGLQVNNNREWFEENRQRYEEHLLKGFRQLVEGLGLYMLEIDPCFEINPKKCVSRIYRDVRFSRDKSPYRANMWLTFKRISKDWKLEPTYFFELFPNYYRYGMGFYEVPREVMEKLRGLIERDDREFKRIDRIYRKQNIFQMEGQTYKRILNNELNEEQLDWYQRKEIFFVSNRGIDELLMDNELIPKLVEDFRTIEPIYKFFLKLCGI